MKWLSCLHMTINLTINCCMKKCESAILLMYIPASIQQSPQLFQIILFERQSSR